MSIYQPPAFPPEGSFPLDMDNRWNVVCLLEMRAREVVAELFPDAIFTKTMMQLNGRERLTEVAVLRPFLQRRGHTVVVRLEPEDAAGWWKCVSVDPAYGGELIDLVAITKFDGNVNQAIDWARAWLAINQVAT